MSYSKMSKFKVGDKVVPFPTEDGYLTQYLVAGSTYTITKIHENGGVDVDGTFKYDRNGENWDSDWFQLTEEKEVKVENTMTAESLRNSILSLQQERVSLQEQIEENIAQEKSLTDQLKELGFLLVESKEQPTNIDDEKKAVLYAEDIEDDMTDSRNWKVGDYLKCISEGWTNFNNGNLYKITDFHCLGDPVICGENNTVVVALIDDFKFHHRPVVN